MLPPPRAAVTGWTGTLTGDAGGALAGTLSGPDGWVLALSGTARAGALHLRFVVRDAGLLAPASEDHGFTGELTERRGASWAFSMAQDGAGFAGAVSGGRWVLQVTGRVRERGVLGLAATVGEGGL